MEKINKINDICLFVKNFQGCLNFYKDKFGFKVKRLQPCPENANYCEFEFQGTSVTMWQEDGFFECVPPKYVEGKGHHFMIAVRVDALESVDEIYEDLTSKGVSCIGEPRTFPFGARAAYFQDLEQNIWEIFAWQEGNGPGILESEADV